MRSTDTSLKHWNGIRSDATLFISDLLKYFIEKHISTDNTGLDTTCLQAVLMFCTTWHEKLAER